MPTAAESWEEDFAVAAHSCDLKVDSIQLRISVNCVKRQHRFRWQQECCRVLPSGVWGCLTSLGLLLIAVAGKLRAILEANAEMSRS